MSIGFVVAGIVLFCNPNVEIIDLLPDFIGCALLLWGLRRLCALSERGESAARALRILLLVNLSKTACLVVFLFVSSSEMTWLLLLTSVFGAGEAALFFYALLRLEGAMTFTAMLHGRPFVYGRECSNFFGWAKFFTVVKCLFSVLPELTFLATDYGEVRPSFAQTNWEFLYTLLTLANILLTSLFGAVTIFLAVRYFRGIARREPGYLLDLSEDYRIQVEQAPGVLPYRRLRWTILFIGGGMLFFLPLRLDGIDMLPDFVGAALLLAAVLLLRRDYPRETKRTAVLLAALAGVALIEWVGDLLMVRSTGYSILAENLPISYAEHLSNLLYHDPDAYTRFLLLLIPTAARCLLFAAALFALSRMLRALIAEHTGAAVSLSPEDLALLEEISAAGDVRDEKNAANAEDTGNPRNTGIPGDAEDTGIVDEASEEERRRESARYLRASSEKKTRETHRRLNRFARAITVLAAAAAIASFLEKALMLQDLPFPLWLPEFLLTAALAALLQVFGNNLRDEMDRKYYFRNFSG